MRKNVKDRPIESGNRMKKSTLKASYCMDLIINEDAIFIPHICHSCSRKSHSQGPSMQELDSSFDDNEVTDDDGDDEGVNVTKM